MCVVLGTLFFTGFPIGAEDGWKQADRGALKQRVEQWMRLDNVSQRIGVGDVFLLADLYASDGNDREAIRWYQEALKVDSWRFESQLTLARLLAKHGDREEAARKAAEVYRLTEDQRLKDEAAAFLLSIKRLGVAEGNGMVAVDVPVDRSGEVVLVPIGDVDAQLLEEVRAALQETVPMTYAIAPETLPLGPPDRRYGSRYLLSLLSSLSPLFSPHEIQEMLQQEGLGEAQLQTDEGKQRLIEAMLRHRGVKGELEQFHDTLTQTGAGGQYDALRLMDAVKARYGTSTPPILGYIGVTAGDIYHGDSNFVFGWAGPGSGIMSYYQFALPDGGAPPDHAKLRERCVKQAVSSSFFLLGIPRCTSSVCIRSYPHSVGEHDRKGTVLCTWCTGRLAEVLREKLKP